MTSSHDAVSPTRFTAFIYEEEGAFLAQCVEIEVASCADTYAEAVANIREAVELYVEEIGDPGKVTPVAVEIVGGLTDPRPTRHTT